MPVFTPEMIARHAQTIQSEPAPTLGNIGKEAARKRAVRIGIPAAIAGNVADLVTTIQAVKSGRASEANPFMKHGAAGMIAVKAGTTAAEAYLLKKMAKDNPKAALILGLTLGGIGAALAAHNHRVGRK